MQETILPEYHVADTDTEAPTLFTNPDAGDKLTIREFIRKPVTWLIVGVALLGVAVALIFTVGRPGAPTPLSIVKADGYSTTMTLDHGQLEAAMGGTTDGINPGDYFTTAAAGINGQNEEVVIGMSDQGKSLEGLLVGYLGGQPGVHVKTVDGGKFIVVSGSESALGSFAGSNAANSGIPAGTTVE